MKSYIVAEIKELNEQYQWNKVANTNRLNNYDN